MCYVTKLKRKEMILKNRNKKKKNIVKKSEIYWNIVEENVIKKNVEEWNKIIKLKNVKKFFCVR